MQLDITSLFSAIIGVIVYLTVSYFKKIVPYYFGKSTQKYLNRLDFELTKRKSFFQKEFDCIQSLWIQFLDLEENIILVPTEIFEEKYNSILKSLSDSSPFLSKDVFSAFSNIINLHDDCSVLKDRYQKKYNEYFIQKDHLITAIRNLYN